MSDIRVNHFPNSVIYGDDANVFSAASVEETWQVAEAEPVCGNCKWWVLPPWVSRAQGVGICRLAESHYGEPVNKLTTAYAMDDEGIHADYRTSPYHACNQWQAKEANDLP